MTENFEFKINEDTEVFYSCSAKLNGEVFVFGGSSTSNNRRKQVDLPKFNFTNIYMFRSQKLLVVSWNGLAILITNSTRERVVHTIIPRKGSCYVFQVLTVASVKGLFVRWNWFLFNFIQLRWICISQSSRFQEWASPHDLGKYWRCSIGCWWMEFKYQQGWNIGYFKQRLDRSCRLSISWIVSFPCLPNWTHMLEYF